MTASRFPCTALLVLLVSLVTSHSFALDDIKKVKALCPPGSLHDRYLNQFKWVRHYLFKNGNLYLTTMADGSILQFAPATMAPLVATVLGRQVHTTDIREMQEAIISPLFRQYAQEHGIKAEESEIAAWVTNMDGAMRNDPALKASQIDDLTAQEKIEVAKMRHKMAGSLITQWKINRELYKKYGGRIIYQQLGPEPLDAYHRYLEIQQRDNVFTIHQPAMKSAFWSYFTDDSRHSFYRPGSEEEEQAFTLPPWEQLRSGKQ